MSRLGYIATAAVVGLCLARSPFALAQEHNGVPADNHLADGHAAAEYSQMLPMFGHDGVFLGYIRYSGCSLYPNGYRPAAGCYGYAR